MTFGISCLESQFGMRIRVASVNDTTKGRTETELTRPSPPFDRYGENERKQ